jgi:hypothetical protein
VKLTVDSSEPIEDAIRVLGALYGVRLVVADSAAERPRGTPAPTPRGTSAGRHKPTSQKGQSAGAASRVGKTRTQKVVSADGAAGRAQVRSWARANGFTLADRGRVPAAIQSAYATAHE